MALPRVPIIVRQNTPGACVLRCPSCRVFAGGYQLGGWRVPDRHGIHGGLPFQGERLCLFTAVYFERRPCSAVFLRKLSVLKHTLRERLDGTCGGRGGGGEVTADFLGNFAANVEIDYGAHAQPPSEARDRLFIEKRGYDR